MPPDAGEQPPARRVTRREVLIGLGGLTLGAAGATGVVTMTGDRVQTPPTGQQEPPTSTPPVSQTAGSDVRLADYGAVGDGVTDDSGALARALAAATSRSGRVLVPAGVYALGSPVSLPSGTSLVGSGAVISAHPRLGSAPVFLARGVENVGLVGLNLVGSTQTDVLMSTAGVHGLTVTSCTLSTARTAGLRLDAGSAIALKGVRFDSTNRGVFGSPHGDAWLEDVTLTGCQFTSMSDAAVYFTGGDTAATRRVVLTDCSASGFLAVGTTRSGFYWVSASGQRHMDIALRNCTLVGNYASFVSGAGNSDFVTLYDIDGAVVSGCNVAGGGDIGISIYRSARVQVTGCEVHDNQSSGISFWNAHDCSAVGNLVYNNRRSFDGDLMGIKGGILCRGATDHILIQGNRCIDTSTPPTQDYGINIESPCRNIILRHNVTTGNESGGVRDEGVDTVVS